MSNIPDTIRIGGFDYKITLQDGLRNELDTRLTGQIDCEGLEIKLEETTKEPFLRLVIWHEIIHGILSHAGIYDHNETNIDALAYGIVQVLRDNPYLRGEDDE